MNNEKLSAYSEQEAIAKVTELEDKSCYIHCFGISGDVFDIAVYASVEDFQVDATNNSNDKIINRYLIKEIQPENYAYNL